MSFEKYLECEHGAAALRNGSRIFAKCCKYERGAASLGSGSRISFANILKCEHGAAALGTDPVFLQNILSTSAELRHLGADPEFRLQIF